MSSLTSPSNPLQCADLEAGEETGSRNGAVPAADGDAAGKPAFRKRIAIGGHCHSRPPAHAGARTKLVRASVPGPVHAVRRSERMRPSSSVAPTGWMQLRHRRRLQHPSHLANTMGPSSALGRRMRDEATTLATLWMREPKDYWRLISYDVDPVWEETVSRILQPPRPRPRPRSTRPLRPI